MPKKLHVACSPLSKSIYAGSVGKDGCSWLSDRTDVTSAAIGAVIEHIGAGHVLTVDLNGKPAFEIEVRAIAQAEHKAPRHGE